MSEEKFTRGPWVARVEYKKSILSKQTYTSLSIHADDKCITYSVYAIHANVDEAVANTWLIAAAPEMYEQLKRHCALCMLVHPDCEGCGICDTGKVLKKARGEK